MIGRTARAAAMATMLAAAAPADAQPVQQLRIYEIYENNKGAFHDRFRDHAMRIMARHGFDIVAMWEAKSPQKTEFVYLLEWRDETAMKAAWEGFMADPEWARIKQETGAVHGKFVGSIEDRTLRLTDYSPGR
ncbi:MAG: NIPSNAP family protein [Phenylobacterium sp.]|nr:NIPSNAP family protein [Phenylobacterium sp.]